MDEESFLIVVFTSITNPNERKGRERNMDHKKEMTKSVSVKPSDSFNQLTAEDGFSPENFDAILGFDNALAKEPENAAPQEENPTDNSDLNFPNNAAKDVDDDFDDFDDFDDDDDYDDDDDEDEDWDEDTDTLNSDSDNARSDDWPDEAQDIAPLGTTGDFFNIYADGFPQEEKKNSRSFFKFGMIFGVVALVGVLGIVLIAGATGKSKNADVEEIALPVVSEADVSATDPATVETTTTTTAPAYKALEPGNKGKDVQKMQERLYKLGYITKESCTGYYGEATQKYLKIFQRNAGLPQTGLADSETLAVLYADDAPRSK